MSDKNKETDQIEDVVDTDTLVADENSPINSVSGLVQINNHDSQLFNSCYDTIKEWVTEDDQFNSNNILAFTIRVMTLVQTMSTDKGLYKKRLTIDLIKRLVTEINYPSELVRKTTLDFIDSSLESFIDVSVGLAIGEIDIGKEIKKIKSCFAKCY